MDSYYVYIHTNSINNKKYVGITKKNNPEDRWLKGKGYQHNVHFQRAIDKYGWDSFSHEIVASNLSKEEACDMEISLIKELNTMNKDFGYNNCEGGQGISGYHHTEETKKKMSERFSGENNPNYLGKSNTPEQMEKLRLANLGSHHTEEHKRKIGDSLRGQHYHSDEFKSNLRKRLQKPIRRSDGIVYPSLYDAAESNNVTPSAIKNSMRRHQKSCGYYLEYVTEKPNDYPERE